MSGGSSHRNGRSVQFIAHWSLVIGVGLMCLLSVAPVVQAASLVVNTLSDADNGSDGVCSLREAIMAANANANHNECTGTGFGDDVIVFSVTGTIHLQSTLPTIAAASSAGKLTIAGPGAASLTLSGDSDNDGNGDVRVVVVNSGGNLILQGLTIAKGLATCSSFCAVNGGGLLNANGTVTISNSTFSGNSAPTGGSLFIGSNSGTTVQIKNSIVANSSSGGD
ncbi:CSLREA domain-containing protein, partial [Candidatus Acetothermia bacterium]|nr:CSLREA domain-containing protein [Candidatus Acetothermia bacterium]